MTTLDFIRLFRSILSPGRAVDAAAIERLGLLAVKIAQMYAVRADLLPEEKCRALGRLLQRMAPMREDEFRRQWETCASPALREALADFDPQPMAAASLGQVHRARLAGGGEVVVKIARPGQRGPFLADVARLRRLLKVALFCYPKLERLADPRGALAAVERTTLTEMDFLQEKSGADQLAALAAEEADRLPHLRKLRFPKVRADLSNASLLVSEFIEGRTLADWLAAGDLPYSALLDLFRIHGYFLFVRGRFHGDLHPGNIIWRDGQFWFLDNANVESIPPAFGAGLFRMLRLLGQGDALAAARTLSGLSSVRLTQARQQEYEKRFLALYDGFAGRTVAEASLTTQMMQTVKMAVRAGLTFPEGAFPLVKSLMYLDGMVLRCNPGAVLLDDVARFAEDFPQAAA